MCESIHSKTVIQLNAQEIVAANWSYRAEAVDDGLASAQWIFTIEECTDCRFVYAGGLPPQDFLAYVYDRLIDTDAARQESFSPRNMANRMDYLATLIRLIEEPGKVLDYGCGFGPTLSLLGTVNGIKTVGFETSSARIAELRSWHDVVLQDPDIVRAHGPFTAVILDNVLEHVPEPRQTIDFLSQVCVVGGILFVSVPDMSKRYLASQIALNRNQEQLAMDINPWEHLNYFDLFHLDRLLSQHGFTALKQSAIPGQIRIGLRPLVELGPRIKNSLASLKRLVAYALVGDALGTPTMRFYRYRAKANLELGTP